MDVGLPFSRFPPLAAWERRWATMAERLARIFGTEEDRVNCPFYFKIGACRHGDQCSRQHNRPVASQCLLIPHMYQQPPAAVAMAEGQDVPDEVADEAQQHFEQFFEEVFMELCNFGQIEDMACVDNVSDHLIGNVYAALARFRAFSQSFYQPLRLFCSG
mmetsp:Transcript_44488/g.100524  ORF Transcript_44488/g.100524 Transcript_44488/m.100524 type:complete len:160 (+) Transcript_44488:57-536(+)